MNINLDQSKLRSSPFKLHSIRVFIVFVLFLTHSFPTFAVSLIAGVPSGESTAAKTLMIAGEGQSPFFRGAGYPAFTGFAFTTYGLGSHFELASTIYNITAPSSGRIAISLGYKWTPQIFKSSSGWNLCAIVGQEFPVSIEGGEGIGHWTFAGASLTVASWKTRLTAGVSTGTRQIFGSTTLDGFFGVEQPLNSHWSVLADWFSGKHDLGALILAAQWDPTSRLTLISGPKISNVSSSSNAWMLEITYKI